MHENSGNKCTEHADKYSVLATVCTEDVSKIPTCWAGLDELGSSLFVNRSIRL